jgi:hypothetical protein
VDEMYLKIRFKMNNLCVEQGYFPMTVDVYDIPFHIPVVKDEVYGIELPEGDYEWRKMNDFIHGNKPVTSFKIIEMLPEWIAKGRAYITANVVEFDEVNCDDELCAATYIHSEIMKLTGAKCIYSCIW